MSIVFYYVFNQVLSLKKYKGGFFQVYISWYIVVEINFYQDRYVELLYCMKRYVYYIIVFYILF